MCGVTDETTEEVWHEDPTSFCLHVEYKFELWKLVLTANRQTDKTVPDSLWTLLDFLNE